MYASACYPCICSNEACNTSAQTGHAGTSGLAHKTLAVCRSHRRMATGCERVLGGPRHLYSDRFCHGTTWPTHTRRKGMWQPLDAPWASMSWWTAPPLAFCFTGHDCCRRTPQVVGFAPANLVSQPRSEAEAAAGAGLSHSSSFCSSARRAQCFGHNLCRTFITDAHPPQQVRQSPVKCPSVVEGCCVGHHIRNCGSRRAIWILHEVSSTCQQGFSLLFTGRSAHRGSPPASRRRRRRSGRIDR